MTYQVGQAVTLAIEDREERCTVKGIASGRVLVTFPRRIWSKRHHEFRDWAWFTPAELAAMGGEAG